MHGETVKKKNTCYLTLILLTCRIWWAPNNSSRWQMGFKSAFKGLKYFLPYDFLSIESIDFSSLPCPL